MFIQTEQTPNPDAVKFLPGRDVSPGGPHDFTSVEEAARSPLAAALFEIDGVVGVFLGEDFIAVTRGGPLGWEQLRAPVLSAIMDHYLSGRPAVLGEGESLPEGPVYEGEAGQIVEEIRQLLDTRIRPAVAQDGGDVLFDHFDMETGVLTLKMRGACAGCPSSTATLKAGIETMMKTYVPEITSVEAA